MESAKCVAQNCVVTTTSSHQRASSMRKRRRNTTSKHHYETLATRLPAEVVRELCQLRQQHLLCDGTLSTSDGCRFHVHRIVVAAASPRLLELLEQNPPPVQLPAAEANDTLVPAVSGEILGLFIDFIYSNQCQLVDSSVCQLLLLAESFQVSSLVQYCMQYIGRGMNTRSCLQYLTFANTHGFSDLADKARQYILYNFTSILDDYCGGNRSSDDRGSSRGERGNSASNSSSGNRTIGGSITSGAVDNEGGNSTRVRDSTIEPEDTNSASRNSRAVVRCCGECGGECGEHQLMNLSGESLISLLNDDLLYVTDERQLFEIIMRWVQYRPMQSGQSPPVPAISSTNRRVLWLPHLVSCVRLGLTSIDYIMSRVSSHSLIAQTQEVNAVVQRAVDALSKQRSSLTSSTGVNSQASGVTEVIDRTIRPRVPGQLVLTVGGWSLGAPVDTVEVYDARADCWLPLAEGDNGSDVAEECSAGGRRAYHGVEAVGSNVYCVGGFDGDEHYSAMQRFSTTTHRWTELACMHQRRCYVSTCVLDGRIVAVGGSDGRQRHSTCEIYDPPPENQWHNLPPLQQSRSDAAAVAVDGRLYVLGGFDGRTVLSSVEIFDRRENCWTFAHAMSQPRSGLSAVVCGQWVYALGGFNGHRRLNSCERLPIFPVASSPVGTDGWQTVAEMQLARSNFAGVVLDGDIVVMGGYDGQSTVAAVERYSVSQNRWSRLADMNVSRSALAACVLENLDNRRYFSFLGHVERQKQEQESLKLQGPRLLPASPL